MSLGPLARLTAHWIGQQMISSCCRGRGTWKGRGWGQDSTRLWLMTGAQPRLPVGKNVTLDWMWRGTDSKAPPDPPSERWRVGGGGTKSLQIPSHGSTWWLLTGKPAACTITEMKLAGWQAYLTSRCWFNHLALELRAWEICGVCL